VFGFAVFRIPIGADYSLVELMGCVRLCSVLIRVSWDALAQQFTGYWAWSSFPGFSLENKENGQLFTMNQTVMSLPKNR
jgi:hypothetical protein